MNCGFGFWIGGKKWVAKIYDIELEMIIGFKV